MFRFRQQYWFCLAAVCLVGSLLALWSTDIRVAEDVSGTLQARHPDVVLRRPARRARKLFAARRPLRY